VPVYKFFSALAVIGHGAWYWGAAVPIIVATLVFLWWRESTGAASLHSRSGDRLFRWLPWMGRMLQCSRSATFLDVLSLLVENQTPLDEAITLAANASGDPKTIRAARQVNDMLQKGVMQPIRPAAESGFPPLMNWLIFAVARGGVLASALHQSAETYHRRARAQSDMVRAILPALLTVVIAGSITMAYAFMLFIPYILMLESLAKTSVR
jgi:type II secretory pathway component PulF